MGKGCNKTFSAHAWHHRTTRHKLCQSWVTSI